VPKLLRNVGGFYKHFGSRDDLIAEAADRAFADGDRTVHEITDGAQDPPAAYVDWYVSTQHRDNPATGCPVAALGDDVRRGDDRVRAAYRRQVERYGDVARTGAPTSAPKRPRMPFPGHAHHREPAWRRAPRRSPRPILGTCSAP
jgi:TetR/AcrR family transcriptional repressor of nem operon